MVCAAPPASPATRGRGAPEGRKAQVRALPQSTNRNPHERCFDAVRCMAAHLVLSCSKLAMPRAQNLRHLWHTCFRRSPLRLRSFLRSALLGGPETWQKVDGPNCLCSCRGRDDFWTRPGVRFSQLGPGRLRPCGGVTALPERLTVARRAFSPWM